MTTNHLAGIAALGGAAVGLERQWSGHAEGPDARFAGIRTFTMLGAIGGISGSPWAAGLAAPAAILLAGAVAIVAAAYVAGSRQDVDGTTEVAARVVLAVSMAKDVAQTVSPAVAAAAIALGVLSNTAMKIALAVAFGSRRFKVITGLALALILIALAAALAVRWLR